MKNGSIVSESSKILSEPRWQHHSHRQHPQQNGRQDASHPTSLCASGWGQAIRRFLCQPLCKRQQREQRGELSAGARWVWRRYLGAAAETGWGPEPRATSWGKYKGAGEARTCDIPTRLTLRPGQSLPVRRSCWEWSHIDQDGDPGGRGETQGVGEGHQARTTRGVPGILWSALWD